MAGAEVPKIRDCPSLSFNVQPELKDAITRISRAHYRNSRADYAREVLRSDIRLRQRYGKDYDTLTALLDRLDSEKVVQTLMALGAGVPIGQGRTVAKVGGQ